MPSRRGAHIVACYVTLCYADADAFFFFPAAITQKSVPSTQARSSSDFPTFFYHAQITRYVIFSSS